MKSVFSIASLTVLLLATLSAIAGKTGAEAAGSITSIPETKSQVEGDFTIEAFGWDDENKKYISKKISVNKSYSYNDIEYDLKGFSQDLSTVAMNAIMALSKAAYAKGLSEYNSLRIETLEKTTKKAISSLDTITIEDVKNEISKSIKKKSTTDGSAKYEAYNFFNVAAAQADGKTIESNSNDRLQIYGFPGADRNNVGLFPVIGNNSGEVGRMMWFDPWNYLDGDTINVDRSDEYSHLPSKASGKHGIHLAGWYTPTANPNKCSSGDTIAEQLKSGANNHYVLTQHKSDSKLHYTEVGQLLTGSAIKIFGTEGDPAVVGSGSTTNTLTFASAGDSNVKVTVSGTGGNATVTIGVYYK